MTQEHETEYAASVGFQENVAQAAGMGDIPPGTRRNSGASGRFAEPLPNSSGWERTTLGAASAAWVLSRDSIALTKTD